MRLALCCHHLWRKNIPLACHCVCICVSIANRQGFMNSKPPKGGHVIPAVRSMVTMIAIPRALVQASTNISGKSGCVSQNWVRPFVCSYQQGTNDLNAFSFKGTPMLLNFSHSSARNTKHHQTIIISKFKGNVYFPHLARL